MKFRRYGEHPDVEVDGLPGLVAHLRNYFGSTLRDYDVDIVRRTDLFVYDGWQSIVAVVVKGGIAGFCEDPAPSEKDRIWEAIVAASAS